MIRMNIKGIEPHLSRVHDFLHEVMRDNWNRAKVRIYFKWDTGALSVKMSFIDVEGVEGVIEDRLSLFKVRKDILEIKKMTIAQHLPKWNFLEYSLDKQTGTGYKVYWNQEEETRRNPVIEYDEESEIESRIHASINQADKLIIRDDKSEYSLKPFYFIKRVDRGIRAIVHEMIVEGSELDLEDFELIDFNQYRWRDLEKIVREKMSLDPEFKMMLDGDWDTKNERFTMAKFKYVFKGVEYPFDIPL